MGSYYSRRMADEDSNSNMSQSDTGSDSGSEQGLPHNYARFLQTLIHSGQVHFLTSDYDNFYTSRRPAKRSAPKPDTTYLDKSEFSFITKQTAGLMNTKTRDVPYEKNITRMLNHREKGLYTNHSFSHGNKCAIFNRYLPNEKSILGESTGKVFCGIFSKDGNSFITASQDRHIRVYNSREESYRLVKSLRARDVGWSIIDVAFSPDRQRFVYSTWSSSLHLCSVNDDSEHQEPLTLLNTARRFCIFSVVFSSDGKELLGGANDSCLYIYDLHRHRSSLKIPAHEYDVNSVVFADDSSHIIYSGGDDGLIKVWDRRTLDESSPKSVGVLAGHMDGITFIDSRGDGRHLISNSKDQSIKLWDVRRFSGEKAAERSLKAVHDQTWDYRWQEVPKKLYSSKGKLEGDTSVMTYRGHIVIKTLIRCRFSPAETTGQRYIYTGCGMGRVVIYDALTGKVKRNVSGHVSCVRDVAWHPTRNEILSSSWDGMVGKWYYRDQESYAESDAWLEKLNTFCCENAPPLRRSLRLAQKKMSEAI